MDLATDGPDGPDALDSGSVYGSSMFDALVDIVRRADPQATLNLEAAVVASRIISLFIATHTTGGRMQLRRTVAQSTDGIFLWIRLFVCGLDEVEGLVPFALIYATERWFQSPRTDEQSTSPGSHTQSNIGNLKGALFPPIIALPQTEALRTRTMARNKLRRSRNNQESDGSILYAAYAPYAAVSDSTIQNMLLRIYDKLHFLDCGFAEYFTSIVDGDAVHIHTQLQNIRRRVASAQNPGVTANAPGDDDDVNLGDLGHFCEQVLQAYEAAKPYKFPGGPSFHVTCGDVTTKLIYLQDALEVPYWSLMLEEFGLWRANSHGLTGKAILSIIYSAKLELKVAVAELRHEAAARGIMEDLAPIIKGIDRRIELLDSVRDSSVDGLHMLEDILRRSDFLPDYYVALLPSTVIIPTPTSRTAVASMVAAICLLVMAIPPFAMGFHLAGKKGGVGSFQDADFWFLVQGNIMSTLGSVLMVVPMLRGPWFSLVYLSVWLMLGGGLVCSIVSVVIFTHVHTGWSNAFVFFGSMMSAWAVLIMVQGEGSKGQEAEKVEVKVKAD